MLDSKFMRTKPDLSPGEELRFNKYIVEIEKRRLEGKSSVRLENLKCNSASASKSSKGKVTSPSAIFSKGKKIGKLSIKSSPVGGLASSIPAFPKKGRKAFVCP